MIFYIQHGCSGCHNSGFPSLKALVEAPSGQGFGFAALQTVFEASEITAFECLSETPQRYGLAIPFGHAPALVAGLRPRRRSVSRRVPLSADYPPTWSLNCKPL